jgi:hypothetical protein
MVEYIYYPHFHQPHTVSTKILVVSAWKLWLLDFELVCLRIPNGTSVMHELHGTTVELMGHFQIHSENDELKVTVTSDPSMILWYMKVSTVYCQIFRVASEGT